MKESNEKLMLELCSDYLKSKDKKLAKYLTKKFNLGTLKDDAPKLEEIITGHFKKSVNPHKNKNGVLKLQKTFKPVVKKHPGNFVKRPGAFVKAPIKANKRLNPKAFTEKKICTHCKRKGHLWSECRLKRCIKCKKYGHTPAQCLGLPCLKCNEFGHRPFECPVDSRKCFNCNKIGHAYGDCKEELNENRFSTLQCHVCEEKGHISRNCPKNSSSCFICGANGHIAKECREKSKIKCHKCEEVGHMVRDCPKNQSVCFKCNEEGHIAKHCTSQTGNPGCFKCGQKDHKQKECPGVVTSEKSKTEEVTESSDGGD